MKKFLLATLSVAIATAAFGQDKPQPITVLEALNIGNALKQLGDYPDNTGKKVSVAFRFSGPVLMTMALNIAKADQVQRDYQSTYNALVRQFADGADTVPPEKMREFTAETEKAINSPVAYSFGRIKEADLCMDMKPTPPCTVSNAIPPALLGALVPIIDR